MRRFISWLRNPLFLATLFSLSIILTVQLAIPKTLEDLARFNQQERLSAIYARTWDWRMPSFSGSISLRSPQVAVQLYVTSKDDILARARALGLPGDTCGFVQTLKGKPVVMVIPPLNTVEDLECWRHEFRHVLEGAWHP